jgi:hypothetical protein
MNSFNDPHPNSLIARATPQVRKYIKDRARQYDADAKSLEVWASNGCLSGAETWATSSGDPTYA